MVFVQNCGVISSLFILLFKFICEFVEYYCPMYNKRSLTLTSIPEKGECDDVKKWVPKNKHEVLKAKYKCLKKLFQIYDASVIGILPEQCAVEGESQDGSAGHRPSKRKKRSTRTKSDACAGTSEYSNGDGTDSNSERGSTIATAVMRELNLNPCSCTSTQFDTATVSKYAGTQASCEDVRKCGCECTQTSELPPPQLPYLMMQSSKPRLTRFQSFIQRLFGIGRDYRTCSPDGHIYAASDNNIMYALGERRRRRGLRFRRLRRPKKTQSEMELRNVKSPMILNYVQSVQRSCLMDTTPRQCPMTGCRMLSYGIINYNDHLNLCHFPERKYICHYCHEGFDNENDKYVHENEHLGITKLNLSTADSSRESSNKSSVTQTDPELTRCEVQDDKLKKIVSFFDKISDPEQVISHMKKGRFSESNLRINKMGSIVADNITSTDVDNSTDGETEKRTVSCMNIRRKLDRRQHSSSRSDATSKCSPICCNYCGESFEFRRQLSLHMDLEHRSHGKYSKFHSCAGMVSPTCPFHSSDTEENLQRSTLTESRSSEQTITRDPSTNVVYTSANATKPSLSSFVWRGATNGSPGRRLFVCDVSCCPCVVSSLI